MELPPDKTLQPTLDPSVVSACAKTPTASIAAELGRQAANERHRIIILGIFGLIVGCTGPIPTDVETDKVVSTREATRNEFEEYCLTVDCRRSVTVRLVRDDGTAFESFYELLPPIVNEGGMVNILPGETIHLAAEGLHGDFLGIRLAREGLPSENGLELAFWQDTEMTNGSDMMLKVQSTFDKSVKFDLGMMTFSSDDIVYTSSCPVLPGKMSLEHWPHAIFQLFVTNFRLLDDSTDFVCE